MEAFSGLMNFMGKFEISLGMRQGSERKEQQRDFRIIIYDDDTQLCDLTCIRLRLGGRLWLIFVDPISVIYKSRRSDSRCRTAGVTTWLFGLAFRHLLDIRTWNSTHIISWIGYGKPWAIISVDIDGALCWIGTEFLRALRTNRPTMLSGCHNTWEVRSSLPRNVKWLADLGAFVMEKWV